MCIMEVASKSSVRPFKKIESSSDTFIEGPIAGSIFRVALASSNCPAMRSSRPAKALSTTVIAAVPSASPISAAKDISRMDPSFPKEKKYFFAINDENDRNCAYLIGFSPPPRNKRSIFSSYSKLSSV